MVEINVFPQKKDENLKDLVIKLATDMKAQYQMVTLRWFTGYEHEKRLESSSNFRRDQSRNSFLRKRKACVQNQSEIMTTFWKTKRTRDGSSLTKV